ncbi:MAG: extradiol dioxygenase [Actinomycetota bacterium]
MPVVGPSLLQVVDDDDQFAFRPARGKPGTFVFFYPASEPTSYSSSATGLQHLAFMVPTRSRVIEVRDAVAALGSEIVHEPQEWPQYPPPYFATFWHDPSGFLLEAVCHHDRD